MSTEPSLPQGVLDKVRALLAKAESTTFDAEAEAFTAKAQELMARHRIDRAVFDVGGRQRPEEPASRRFGVGDPYADAKAMLLANVADANGCRAVWSKGGVHDRVRVRRRARRGRRAVHLAARAGHRRAAPGGIEVRRIRTEPHHSFPAIVPGRLCHPHRAATPRDRRRHRRSAVAETGSALVPILAARAGAASAAAEAAFPDTRRFRPSVTDGEGWHAGTRFADQADLSTDPELTRRTA